MKHLKTYHHDQWNDFRKENFYMRSIAKVEEIKIIKEYK